MSDYSVSEARMKAVLAQHYKPRAKSIRSIKTLALGEYMREGVDWFVGTEEGDTVVVSSRKEKLGVLRGFDPEKVKCRWNGFSIEIIPRSW